jgi:hypothetical protein
VDNFVVSLGTGIGALIAHAQFTTTDTRPKPFIGFSVPDFGKLRATDVTQNVRSTKILTARNDIAGVKDGNARLDFRTRRVTELRAQLEFVRTIKPIP